LLDNFTSPRFGVELPYIEKAVAEISVELMDGQEVFGRHASGITSQPTLAANDGVLRTSEI
jgi:hypothetical protein